MIPFEGECNHCKQWGHMKWQCPVLDKEMAEKRARAAAAGGKGGGAWPGQASATAWAGQASAASATGQQRAASTSPTMELGNDWFLKPSAASPGGFAGAPAVSGAMGQGPRVFNLMVAPVEVSNSFAKLQAADGKWSESSGEQSEEDECTKLIQDIQTVVRVVEPRGRMRTKNRRYKKNKRETREFEQAVDEEMRPEILSGNALSDGLELLREYDAGYPGVLPAEFLEDDVDVGVNVAQALIEAAELI